MRVMVAGELLGMCFVITVAYYLLNDTEATLLQTIKIMMVLYLPQRIALYLQCKSLVDQKIRRMEKKENE